MERGADRQGVGCGSEVNSILLHRRIDLVRPAGDSAFEIKNVGKARSAQQLYSLRAAHTGMAVHDCVPAMIKFIQPIRQFSQRNQLRTFDLRDLIFEGFAHIDQLDWMSRIKTPLQLLHGDRRESRRDSAKPFVVDWSCNGRPLAPDGTLWIAAQIELAKLHL